MGQIKKEDGQKWLVGVVEGGGKGADVSQVLFSFTA